MPELKALGVGWGLLTVTLGIRNKRQRHAMLHRAVEEKWGARELQRAIQQRKGIRRGGGRRRKEPRGQGLLPDLAELLGLTGRWLKFHEAVWSQGQREYVRELRRMASKARAGVSGVLGRAKKELADLQKRCREAEETVESLRDRLPDGGR